MAAQDSFNPFSPEETQRILHHLQQPAVFMNMTGGWPVLHWTVEHLSGCLGDKLIRFRLGRKEETNTPLFETQCSYVEAKLEQFLSWTKDQAGADLGPFCEYPKSEYWAYADYKYIAMLFQEQPSMFEDVKWSEFGFEGRNGRESTLWIGTEGANTPCHLDSYGCNLVLQVQGRKRWHLFSPEDTVRLYPTRIPYEESSVFSQVDVLHPDLRRFPKFKGARMHTVTLQPGQVLYVPRHWWHYVDSVDPLTVSVNSWIELEADDVARVGEAVVCALKSDDDPDDWLNPTEEGVASHNENMQCVNLAVRACSERHRKLTQDPRDLHPVKRDSRGQIKKNSDSVGGSAPYSVPFGPHLVPVRCQQEHFLEDESSSYCDVRSQEDAAVGSDAAPRAKPASAVRLCQEKHDLTRCGSCDAADGTSENSSGDCEEPAHTTITTNDLLDCLVHPDVISRVTELLLERHTGSHRTCTPS
ncbi:HSPB1-associated protein 1 homolog [Plectropomus leopardus]|uniref:HSPB1-associated protein 1 homolog n=1 Tax=Plectropomus leopardus TaxID=160734 RepID=UPI001C4C54A0|nr:HSPB1-associated protein 1 homolog [Plectropomus leopardus]XP_042350021.1 HSPB1-associated protein 1 homolog [Plectropomus leopardus]